jgi:ribosomal protein S18 acetylase RimI-like enzyme
MSPTFGGSDIIRGQSAKPMAIRPLRADEVDKLIVLWKAFMNDPSAMDGLILAHEENARRMAEFVTKLIADDPNQVLVAEDGGSLVGYLIFENHAKSALETSRQWGKIEDLYVVPSHRQRGIGGDLLRACVAYLRTVGVSGVRLNVWSENQGAIRLYRKLGFKDYVLVMEAETKQAGQPTA